MYSKIICILVMLCFLFISLGCEIDGDPDPTATPGELSETLKEYAFLVLTICTFLPLDPESGVTTTIEGNVATYTYTDSSYSETDIDAVVNGTIVETDNFPAYSDDMDLVFSNDDMGLETISGDVVGDNSITAGTLYINGFSVPATEYQEFLDDLFS